MIELVASLTVSTVTCMLTEVSGLTALASQLLPERSERLLAFAKTNLLIN